MKWNNLLFLILLLGSLFLLVCSGCSSVRRTKTKVITEYKVDTIVRVHFDTIPIIRTGFLTDTVFVENKVAQARSYYSVSKQRIVLELKGKSFDVPVQLAKSVIETKKEVHKKGLPFYIWMLSGAFITITVTLLIKIKNMIKK